MSKHTGILALAAIAVLADCSSAAHEANVVPAGPLDTLRKPATFSGFAAPAIANKFSQPALLELNDPGEDIGYWPITDHGGSKPHQLVAPSGIDFPNDIAADGERIAIANEAQNILTYDLRTGNEHMLPDAGWYPIYLAFDRHHAIYVANVSTSNSKSYSLTKYAAGQQPMQLTCGLLGDPAGIAVDSAGNIFVNENSPQREVIEFPAGKQRCRQVLLQPLSSYAAGLAIDPRNDDLLVLSNPGECAGSQEGLLTIYHKPYKPQDTQQVLLGGNCVNNLRLSADEKTVFVIDETVSGGATFVNQFAYPSGLPMGTYFGGHPSAITTIPNRWP